MKTVEPVRVWVPYEQVHADAKVMFDRIRALSEGPLVLIALARGGWLPTRLVSAMCEEQGVSHITFSVAANYRDLGTPRERVAINQGLDDVASRQVQDALENGASPWLVDGPYAMGNVATAAKEYLSGLFEFALKNEPIRVAALHWVTFQVSTPAPWRVCAREPPNAFGRKLQTIEKPYIDYPWEYGTFGSDERDTS